MKNGIQVSSFKPVLTTEAEVKTAFEKMKEMGCEWVQLQWIDPAVSIDFIAQCLKETGIRSVSVQDFYEVIRQNKQYYIDLNAQTGGTWMCVSRVPDRLKTRAGLDDYVAELRAFQQELDGYGQKLCFHAVGKDFAPIDGMDPVAYLLDAMPELAICVDFYNIRKAGHPPALPDTTYRREDSHELRKIPYPTGKSGNAHPPALHPGHRGNPLRGQRDLHESAGQ